MRRRSRGTVLNFSSFGWFCWLPLQTATLVSSSSAAAASSPFICSSHMVSFSLHQSFHLPLPPLSSPPPPPMLLLLNSVFVLLFVSAQRIRKLTSSCSLSCGSAACADLQSGSRRTLQGCFNLIEESIVTLGVKAKEKHTIIPAFFPNVSLQVAESLSFLSAGAADRNILLLFTQTHLRCILPFKAYYYSKKLLFHI